MSEKFNENFKLAMENIRSMADANTVIGEPIITSNGSTIIPVSKLSMGYISGGLDYNSKKNEDETKTRPIPKNFGGAGASGLSVSPVAFLVVDKNGNVEMLNVNAPLGNPDPVSSVIGLIERSPDLIERLRNVLGKNKKTEDEEEDFSVE